MVHDERVIEHDEPVRRPGAERPSAPAAAPAEGAQRRRTGTGRAAATRTRRRVRRTPWPQASAGEAGLTLKEEIAALRDLIRQEWAAGAEAKDLVRMVDALGRALKVQYGLEGRAAQGLEEALARALAEIGNELGMTL